ncbi:unnamed protein product [Calypogeia fissa]
MEGKGSAKTRWTERVCVLVVKAVMHVEEEMMNSTKPTGHSTGRYRSKWERIASLLPPYLRGKTWDCRLKKHTGYKCRNLFPRLLKAYRSMKQYGDEGRPTAKLTPPVLELLKKREQRFRCGASIPYAQSSKSEIVNTGVITRSTGVPKQLSATNNNSRDTDSNTSKLWSSPKDSKDITEISAQPGGKHRDQTRSLRRSLSSNTRLPSDLELASSFAVESTALMTQTVADEHRHDLLDGVLRRLHLEISSLSLWVQSQLTPIQEKVIELNTSANRSGKTRKRNVGTASEPLKSASRRMDLQIQAFFLNLTIC